jgi:hypothetical protein
MVHRGSGTRRFKACLTLSNAFSGLLPPLALNRKGAVSGSSARAAADSGIRKSRLDLCLAAWRRVTSR